MPYVNDLALDDLLARVRESNRLDVCTAEPTTYTQATSTLSVANRTSPTIGVQANATPDGRRVTVAAISGGTITNTGVASHWALTDTANSRLLAAGQLSITQNFVAGNTFSLTAFDIRVSDAVDDTPPSVHLTNFTTGDWVAENISFSSGYEDAAGGSLAYTATTTTTGFRRFYRNLGSSTLPRSILAKAGTAAFVGMRIEGAVDIVVFDLTNGTVTDEINGNGTIAPLGNGWYKLTMAPAVAGPWIQVWMGNTRAQAGDVSSWSISGLTTHFSSASVGTTELS